MRDRATQCCPVLASLDIERTVSFYRSRLAAWHGGPPACACRHTRWTVTPPSTRSMASSRSSPKVIESDLRRSRRGEDWRMCTLSVAAPLSLRGCHSVSRLQAPAPLFRHGAGCLGLRDGWRMEVRPSETPHEELASVYAFRSQRIRRMPSPHAKQLAAATEELVANLGKYRPASGKWFCITGTDEQR